MISSLMQRPENEKGRGITAPCRNPSFVGPASSGGTLCHSPMRRHAEASAREKNEKRLTMSDQIIKDNFGRKYRLFPQKISWRFDGELDHPDETKHAVVIVGKMEGDVFVIMDIWACRGLVINDFKGWWQTGLCRAGADHVATIWVDEEQDDLHQVASSLRKANLPASGAQLE
jgi:hypothetical protein